LFLHYVKQFDLM